MVAPKFLSKNRKNVVVIANFFTCVFIVLFWIIQTIKIKTGEDVIIYLVSTAFYIYVFYNLFIGGRVFRFLIVIFLIDILLEVFHDVGFESLKLIFLYVLASLVLISNILAIWLNSQTGKGDRINGG